MPRIISVWLPRWPIRRFLAAQSRTSTPAPTPVDPDRPFVLMVEAAGWPRIAALNEAAYAEGLAVRVLLADARAKVTTLQVRPADPAADDAALRRLALWATRYTPTVSPWGEENGADGFTDGTHAEVTAQHEKEEQKRRDDRGHLMLLDQSDSAEDAAEDRLMLWALSCHISSKVLQRCSNGAMSPF